VSARYSVHSLERGSASADAGDGPVPSGRTTPARCATAPQSAPLCSRQPRFRSFSGFCARTRSYNGRQSLRSNRDKGSSLRRIPTPSVRRYAHTFIRDVCLLRTFKAQWYHLLLTH
jgi:ribosomal protein L34